MEEKTVFKFSALIVNLLKQQRQTYKDAASQYPTFDHTDYLRWAWELLAKTELVLPLGFLRGRMRENRVMYPTHRHAKMYIKVE
jgi:hypothetical protein